MDINKEILDRIFSAADMLYEQNGRDAFPTVGEVRKAAKVNMSDASAGMREWRRKQTAPAAQVHIQVPEDVQQAGNQAIVTLWKKAEDLANESLRAAQSGWEADLADLGAINKEISDAHEVQARELDLAQQQTEAIKVAGEEAAKQAAANLDALRTELTEATTRAERAEATAEEIERRADELRSELAEEKQASKEAAKQAATNLDALRAELAQATTRAERIQVKAEEIEHRADELRSELAEEKQASKEAAKQAATNLDALRAELAQATTRAERAEAKAEEIKHQADELRNALAEEKQASSIKVQQMADSNNQIQKAAAEAREQAAGLAGKLEAIQGQNTALLARLAGGEGKPGTAKTKKASSQADE